MLGSSSTGSYLVHLSKILFHGGGWLVSDYQMAAIDWHVNPLARQHSVLGIEGILRDGEGLGLRRVYLVKCHTFLSLPLISNPPPII